MFITPVNSFTGRTSLVNTQKNSDSVSFGIRPRPPKGLSGSAAYYYEAFVANRKTPKWPEGSMGDLQQRLDKVLKKALKQENPVEWGADALKKFANKFDSASLAEKGSTMKNWVKGLVRSEKGGPTFADKLIEYITDDGKNLATEELLVKIQKSGLLDK